MNLPIEVGAESVAIDDTAVLRLELLAIETDEQGANIIEKLVYPCQVDQTLIYGLLCCQPLFTCAHVLFLCARP